jgi:hypothetical protein
MNQSDNGHALSQRNGIPSGMSKAELRALREQVRMLGISLGSWREAARQCGLKEDRVLQWAHRYSWTLPDRTLAVRQSDQPIVSSGVSSGVIKPAEVLTRTLQERKERSALSLSKYVVDASDRLAKSEGELRHARSGSDVVRIRQSVWPEVGAGSQMDLAACLDEQGKVRELHARLRAVFTGEECATRV